MKSKMVCKQLLSSLSSSERMYEVVSLTNRTTPYIGDTLSEKQVKNLLVDGRGNLTIEIKGK